jgi:hypothetical protein
MSPNWDGLRDVVTQYVSDAAPPGGDSPRAIVLAAIDRLRAALERPRPPERVHDDVTRSDHDGARASDVLGEAPERADTPSVAGDRTESEKERRVHYQDIVYGVLARLETLTGERNTQATREATIALLERALERPRPAPPEPSATFTARQTLESEPCNYCGEGAKVFFSLNPEAMPDICPACFVTALGFAEPDAETFTLLPKRSPGGSAGTGAAPPDLRDRVRDDWTAGYKAGQESGVPPSPEGANERFERIAAEFYEDTGYLRPGKDVPAAVGGESYDRERNAAWKIWNAARVRGGAAQPPPSAPEQANSRWVQTIVRSPLCQAEGHLPSGDDSYCLRCGAVQEGEK